MAGNELTLAVDFGSTYTKVTAVDLEEETIVASSNGPSTVDTDIMDGLNVALERLKEKTGIYREYGRRLACSSAAGGLRMVTVGLVPDLTAEAGKRAALGAGAKVVGVCNFKLNNNEISHIESLTPDIILLCGGTDGGNSTYICANARALASSKTDCPIVVAGNKDAADEVKDILEGTGRPARVTDNVMPEIGVLHVEPAQEAIRGIFIERIVEAKGFKKAESFVEGILMPTPTAVMKAMDLIAKGAGGESGLGELMAVDVGGATTDVYSAASGRSTQANVFVRGLPEPFLKRTVEGDIGMRYSLDGILGAIGVDRLAQDSGLAPQYIEDYVARVKENVGRVAETEDEWLAELTLAGAAVEVATERHAGTVSSQYTLHGEVLVQQGKDLTEVPTVIGTGGGIVRHRQPRQVLERALFSPQKPFSLRPKASRFFVDTQYMLYAVGLLSEINPKKALKIAKRYLTQL